MMRALWDVKPNDFDLTTPPAFTDQPVSAMRRWATDPIMDVHLA